MIGQSESVTGCDRATIGRSGGRGNLAVKCFHRILNGSLTVVKDLIQFARLLAPAFVDTIVFSSVTARVIVAFKFLTIGERKLAWLFEIEFVGRKLKVVIPQRDFAGLQLIVAQK